MGKECIKGKARQGTDLYSEKRRQWGRKLKGHTLWRGEIFIDSQFKTSRLLVKVCESVATDKAAYISTYKVRPTWAWRAQQGPRPGRRRSFQSHCLLHWHRTVTFPQDGSSELCRPVDRQEGNIGSVEGFFSGCLPPTPNSHLFFISAFFFAAYAKQRAR